MNKAALGTKRDCPECGARFYDLLKDPAHCPKCQHEFIPEALLKPRKTRAEEETVKKEEGEIKTPAQETSLDEADEENKAAESKRKNALDDDEDDTEETVGEDIPDIEGIGVDLDDDDDADTDDSLLVDDDDDDVSAIVKPTSDED